jgi:membrane associated rhomboid family serine protease
VIFPLLNGLMSWRKAPVTWAIFLLNFVVLLYTSTSGVESQRGLDEVMKQHYFMTAQGRIYAQYLEDHPKDDYPKFLRELGAQVREGVADRAEMLGQLAFRDFNFLNRAESISFDADPVALKLWRKKVDEIRVLQEDHPSYLLGLNADDPSLAKWVSYIFVHSGWFHFFGNMLFLLIFGAALERQIGGLGFLVTFVMSGTFAAGVFALMTGVTSSPLVGASGAISGIMALYCVLNWGHPERYFYWLFLPLRGFMGFVYLPAWVALALWAANDVAGYVGTLPELGGVAHTAHLGGELAGLIAGLTLLGLRRVWPVNEPHPSANLEGQPMGRLMPFLPPRRVLKPTARGA